MKKLFALLLITPMLFTACGDDDENDIQLKNNSATLFQRDTYQIEATSQASIKYTVKRPYHATVSDDGLITAGYVGETDILLDNGEKSTIFKVKILPRYDLFRDPFIEWGVTKEALTQKLGTTGYEADDENNMITYPTKLNYKNVMGTRFFFDTQDRLIATMLFLYNNHYEAAIRHLLERYPFIETSVLENGKYIHIYANANNYEDATLTIAIIETDFNYFAIQYTPINMERTQKSSERKEPSWNKKFIKIE